MKAANPGVVIDIGKDTPTAAHTRTQPSGTDTRTAHKVDGIVKAASVSALTLASNAQTLASTAQFNIRAALRSPIGAVLGVCLLTFLYCIPVIFAAPPFGAGYLKWVQKITESGSRAGTCVRMIVR